MSNFITFDFLIFSENDRDINVKNQTKDIHAIETIFMLDLMANLCTEKMGCN